MVAAEMCSHVPFVATFSTWSLENLVLELKSS